jgi:3'(2'), 5'-bisphosphate nucleotidase
VTTAELQNLLPDIVQLARDAGVAIMKIYGDSFDVRAKADASPLTEADEASEAVILARLARLTPDILAISEERMSREGHRGDVPRRFWLVDPLDGTREFVSRNGEFSVNIALIEDRRPVLGVVFAPAARVLWAAAGHGTAFVEKEDGAPKPIRCRTPPAGGIVVLASRSHGDAATLDAFLEDYKVAERRGIGSALKFGIVAEGQADLYPRFGNTMEWDTAAGHAVLLAAGGRIETVTGAPLSYGKPAFRNPDFIAYGA